MKKLAALTVESERFLETEECDVGTDKNKSVSECKEFPENQAIILIKKVKDCKPFIGVSVLFLCVSITLTGVMILKSKHNVLPY